MLLFELAPVTIPLGTMSVSGLAPIFVVAAIGGIVAAMIAPQHKLLIAIGTGALYPGVAYGLILFTVKYAHYDPFMTSWTLGMPISYLVGGLIGRRVHAN